MTLAQQLEQRGMQRGEAAIILRQMQRRFGHIPKTYEQHIIQADADTLLAFGEKILEANTLEDLFVDDDLD